MIPYVHQWRGEISERKDMRPTLDADRIEGLFAKAHALLLPPTLVAYTVLGCEWVFRIRRATEADIRRELEAMEANLSKPLHQALTPFQAHLVIRSLEPELRKRLKNTRVVIPIGFFSPGWHSTWRLGGRTEKTAAELVPLRSGPPPVLGPILAGLTIETLLESSGDKAARGLGRAFTSAFLPREVQAQEFKGWKGRLDDLPPFGTEGSPRFWLAAQIQRNHEKHFLRDGLSPDDFLEECGKAPESLFSALVERNLLSSLYGARWG